MGMTAMTRSPDCCTESRTLDALLTDVRGTPRLHVLQEQMRVLQSACGCVAATVCLAAGIVLFVYLVRHGRMGNLAGARLLTAVAAFSLGCAVVGKITSILVSRLRYLRVSRLWREELARLRAARGSIRRPQLE
jgi:hypothetical protein